MTCLLFLLCLSSVRDSRDMPWTFIRSKLFPFISLVDRKSSNLMCFSMFSFVIGVIPELICIWVWFCFLLLRSFLRENSRCHVSVELISLFHCLESFQIALPEHCDHCTLEMSTRRFTIGGRCECSTMTSQISTAMTRTTDWDSQGTWWRLMACCCCCY